MWTAFPPSWANAEKQIINGKKNFITSSFNFFFFFNNLKGGKVAGRLQRALKKTNRQGCKERKETVRFFFTASLLSWRLLGGSFCSTAMLHAVWQPFINHILPPELLRFSNLALVECCHFLGNAPWERMNIHLTYNATAIA